MTGNEEFELGLTDEPGVPPAPPEDDEVVVKVKGKGAKAAKADPVADKTFDKTTTPKGKDTVRIMIDEVPGMNNYEVVGVNGKVYQIKRGIPVDVPREVMTTLESCQMTVVEQKKNKYTGESEDVTRHFSAVPWRRV